MSKKRLFIMIAAVIALIFGLICLSTISIKLFWIAAFLGLPISIYYIFDGYYHVNPLK
ncbi:hypothetical protein ACWOAH_06750 [Vagococcus vulneris]|uniref:hypothetical protein n=1 Tax=Vagococcus vulneris TaxID=1977869 RepID=UPI001402A64F|nr:hypothetical protein [Vagococcus vulneris]